MDDRPDHRRRRRLDVLTDRPDPDMLAAAGRVAAFLETGDPALPARTFASRDVVIIENFAPFVFEGPDAVGRWAAAMSAHLSGAWDLRHDFGAVQDFRRVDDTAYFAMPTTWRGLAGGRAFTETGGWSFVLVQENGEWRVRAYGWAVTSHSYDSSP